MTTRISTTGTWDDEANDKDESGADGPDTSLADNQPFTGCNHNGTELRISGTLACARQG